MNPLTAADREVVNGIPVTIVAVTLVHLAAGGHNSGKAMDDALRCGNTPNELHGSPSAQQRDLTRKRKLRVLGWEIVDVWWSDLHRMDEVLVDVRLAIATARARNLAQNTTTKSVGASYRPDNEHRPVAAPVAE